MSMGLFLLNSITIALVKKDRDCIQPHLQLRETILSKAREILMAVHFKTTFCFQWRETISFVFAREEKK